MLLMEIARAQREWRERTFVGSLVVDKGVSGCDKKEKRWMGV